jgi:hypothetical protein
MGHSHPTHVTMGSRHRMKCALHHLVALLHHTYVAHFDAIYARKRASGEPDWKALKHRIVHPPPLHAGVTTLPMHARIPR